MLLCTVAVLPPPLTGAGAVADTGDGRLVEGLEAPVAVCCLLAGAGAALQRLAPPRRGGRFDCAAGAALLPLVCS
jgi:hypothetical protein